MQLGMIGLGRMGANLVRRLMRAGHDCVCTSKRSKAGRCVPHVCAVNRLPET